MGQRALRDQARRISPVYKGGRNEGKKSRLKIDFARGVRQGSDEAGVRYRQNLAKRFLPDVQYGQNRATRTKNR